MKLAPAGIDLHLLDVNDDSPKHECGLAALYWLDEPYDGGAQDRSLSE